MNVLTQSERSEIEMALLVQIANLEKVVALAASSNNRVVSDTFESSLTDCKSALIKIRAMGQS